MPRLRECLIANIALAELFTASTLATATAPKKPCKVGLVCILQKRALQHKTDVKNTVFHCILKFYTNFY